jgi:hypothetical protein
MHDCHLFQEQANGVRSILLMFGRAPTMATPVETPPPSSCFVTLPAHAAHSADAPRYPPAGTGPVNRRRNRLTNCCLLGSAANPCRNRRTPCAAA